MQQSRRHFVKNISGLALGAAGMVTFNPGLAEVIEDFQPSSERTDFTTNEDFWYQVRKAFRQSPHFINLESGYFSPQPLEVMGSQIDNIKMVNEEASFYMRRRQTKEMLEVKKNLASFSGVSHEEIVVTRNTTEALDTVILGMEMRPGDEAIMTDQDYGSMLQCFAMRAKRFGTVNKIIKIPLHPESDEKIVQAYENAITPRTKVMLVTHMINLTGQILPVRKIADMAHANGIEVIADATHSFAHIEFSIPDLHCDYLGTSLHKWLCCPLGSGMLYVSKDKIAKTWPLFGDVQVAPDDIRKFEHIGTHPVSTNLTIDAAIKFHNAIGSKRKEDRLRYLKNYWVNQVKNLPKVVINTPFEDHRSCGIGNFSISGMTPDKIADYLYDEHRIFTVAINRESVKGVRVTPHLFTSLPELDRLVLAIKELSKA